MRVRRAMMRTRARIAERSIVRAAPQEARVEVPNLSDSSRTSLRARLKGAKLARAESTEEAYRRCGGRRNLRGFQMERDYFWLITAGPLLVALMFVADHMGLV